MADAIDGLQYDPEPEKGWRRWPSPSHGKKQAPEAEGDENGVDDDKSEPVVGRNQSGHGSCGKERVPETTDVLLDRVRELSEDQGTEGDLDS